MPLGPEGPGETTGKARGRNKAASEEGQRGGGGNQTSQIKLTVLINLSWRGLPLHNARDPARILEERQVCLRVTLQR